MNKPLMSVIILTCITACDKKPVEIDYSGPIDNWANQGKDEGGGHHSRRDQITPENVACIELA